MATFEELRNLFTDDALRNRITTATIIAAYDLITDTVPTANDRAWAYTVFKNPDVVGQEVYMAVLASNSAATVNGIKTASDSAIKSAVDVVVPQIVLAYSGA